MLYISTSKIHESTVGASFTVSFSVAPDEIGYLTALHEKYAEMNMCGFTIKPNCSEKPNNCETCKYEDLESYEGACDDCTDMEGRPTNYEPKTEPMKTADYCDICKRDMCEGCVADATNPYCVPSHYEIRHEPKTEPLDKDTNVRNKDCETCKHSEKEWYELPCRSCKDFDMYESKTEPQTDPCDGCVCDDGKHLMYCMNCKGIAWKTEPSKVEDEPQTDDAYSYDEDDWYDKTERSEW